MCIKKMGFSCYFPLECLTELPLESKRALGFVGLWELGSPVPDPITRVGPGRGEERVHPCAGRAGLQNFWKQERENKAGVASSSVFNKTSRLEVAAEEKLSARHSKGDSTCTPREEQSLKQSQCSPSKGKAGRGIRKKREVHWHCWSRKVTRNKAVLGFHILLQPQPGRKSCSSSSSCSSSWPRERSCPAGCSAPGPKGWVCTRGLQRFSRALRFLPAVCSECRQILG